MAATRHVISFSAGGSKEEIKEAYRLFDEVGIPAVGYPVEDLTQVEKTIPGSRTFVGLDGIREYIQSLTKKRDA